jgi:PAS domain S-box-containing protein
VEIEALKTAANIIGAAIQHKQAEEAVLDSEKKYRQLFENDSDAVMIFDAETLRFEDANPATLNLFGYSKKEFLALTVEDISAEKEKTRSAVEKVSHDETRSMKIPLRYFRRKDGSIFPGEISAGNFSSGGRQKIIGALRDITERILAEDKIRALTRELIKVQENERNRIAKYLHDHVAQDLSTLKIGLETLFDEPQKLSPKKKKKISEAFQAGASGFVVKESAAEGLLKGIKTVLKGDYFLDSAVSTQVVEALMKLPGKETKITDARYGTLTAREQEVLRPLAEGLSSKEIAQKLFISPKTVENHRANIMNKLDLHSTIELVRYAAKLGLIDVDLWTN